MKDIIPDIGIFRWVLFLIFISLCSGLIFAFSKRQGTSELNITAQIQTGSALDWKLEPKAGDPMVIVPAWANRYVSIAAKRIRFTVGGGKHALIHIFVDPSGEDFDKRTLTPRSSTAIFKANEPFRTRVGPLFSGFIRFHERGHLALVIPEAMTSLVSGKHGEQFYLGFSEVTYDFGKQKPNKIWGEYPLIILPSEPPKYQGFDDQGLLSVMLESSKSSIISKLGPGLYVQPDIDGIVDMSLAVSYLKLSGFSNGSLFVEGSTRAVSPSDSITASFSGWEPGQIQIENMHGNMSISGVANTITKNGTDLRPRVLETWPWWIQWLYPFSIGLCGTPLLAPIWNRWTKKPKAADDQ